MNSLSFRFSEIIFFSFSILKGVFAGYCILVSPYHLSFGNLMVVYIFHVSFISDTDSGVCLIFALCTEYVSYWGCFSDFLLSLVLSNRILMCSSAVLVYMSCLGFVDILGCVYLRFFSNMKNL